MKTFSYYDYREKCPIAVKVEDAMNDCGSAKIHLEKLENIFSAPCVIDAFLTACICYWSEAESYDGRNAYAVLTSRKIVEHYDYLKANCDHFTDDLLINAYGFTRSAHRYLQNELFKTALEFYSVYEDETRDIAPWLNEMAFVFNKDQTDLIPYKDRMATYGY